MKLAFSPCPNDTFVFHAWAHGLARRAPRRSRSPSPTSTSPTPRAERGEFDVVKVSYAALPWLLDAYALLPCGGALGRGCGPLVLTRGDVDSAGRAHGRGARASGRRPTCCSGCGPAGSGRPASTSCRSPRSCRPCATGVRRRAGDPRGPVHLPVVRADRAGRPRRVVGAGHRPADPARRHPGPARARRRRADRGRPRLGRARLGRPGRRRRDYIAEHADEMAPDVQQQHIDLYVNEFTRDLGEEGYAAVEALLGRAHAAGLHPSVPAAALIGRLGASTRCALRRRGCRRTRAAARRPCGPRRARGSVRGAASWTRCRAA